MENCRFFARAQDVDLSPVTVSVPVSSPSPTFHARVKTTLVANRFQESTLFTWVFNIERWFVKTDYDASGQCTCVRTVSWCMCKCYRQTLILCNVVILKLWTGYGKNATWNVFFIAKWCIFSCWRSFYSRQVITTVLMCDIKTLRRNKQLRFDFGTLGLIFESSLQGHS